MGTVLCLSTHAQATGTALYLSTQAQVVETVFYPSMATSTIPCLVMVMEFLPLTGTNLLLTILLYQVAGTSRNPTGVLHLDTLGPLLELPLLWAFSLMEALMPTGTLQTVLQVVLQVVSVPIHLIISLASLSHP